MHINIKYKIFSLLLLICLSNVLSIQLQGNNKEKKIESFLLLTINFSSAMTKSEEKNVLCFFKNNSHLKNNQILTPFNETCDQIKSNTSEDEYFETHSRKYFIFNNNSQFFNKFYKNDIDFILREEIEKKTSNFSNNPIKSYSLEEIDITTNTTDSLAVLRIIKISESSINFTIKSKIKFCWFTYSFIEYQFGRKIDTNIEHFEYRTLLENEILEVEKKELKENTCYQLKINIFSGLEHIKETQILEFQTLSSKILFEEIFVQNTNSSLIIRTGCYADCEIYLGLDTIPTFSPNTFQFKNGLNGNNKSFAAYFQNTSSAKNQIYTLKIDNLKHEKYKLWIRGIRNVDKAESALIEYEFENKKDDFLQEAPRLKLIEVSKSKNSIKFSFQILNSDGYLFLGLDYFEGDGKNTGNNSIPDLNQLTWGRNYKNVRFINFTKAFVEKDHMYTFEYKKKIKDKNYILYYGTSEKDLRANYEGPVAHLIVENSSIRMEVIIFIYFLMIFMVFN